MTTNPVISVSLVTYNHERFVAEAIDSVLRQTFSDFELIIVNDGSTDATGERIRAFKDPRITVIDQENQGPGAASNRAIAAARGKYVALMSGDDRCYPDRLDRQLREYASGPRRVLFGQADFIDDEGRPIEGPHFASAAFEKHPLSRAQILRRFFRQGNFLNGVTTFTESEVFLEAGPYDPSLFQLQDFEMWIRLVKKYELCISPEYVVEYRIRGGDGNLSRPNHERTLRVYNETYLISRKFFNGVTSELFHEAFGRDLIRPHCENDIEQKCEQAFLFLNSSLDLHQLIGIEMLHDLLAAPDTANTLAELYKFTPVSFANALKKTERFESALYVDTGQGFTATQRVTARTMPGRFELTFDLSGFSQIRAVRWDPVEGHWCKVSMTGARFHKVEGHTTPVDIDTLRNNGTRSNDGSILFETTDSMFFISPVDNAIALTVDGSWERIKTEETVSRFEVTRTRLAERELKSSPTARRFCQVLEPIQWTATLRILPEVWHRLGLRRDRKLISASGLFDADWYRDRYADVRDSGRTPAVHYLEYGVGEGKDPNPLFDTRWYLDRYPDVRQAGTNPLVHYLRRGAAEGRDPNPFFDNNWYLEQYPDVRNAGANPLVHYLKHGAKEGRPTRPLHAVERNPSDSRPTSSQGLKSPRYYFGYEGSKSRYAEPSSMTAAPRPRRSTNSDRGPDLADASVSPQKLNVIFVTYGSLSSNSGWHVTGFANALAERGHHVIACAEATLPGAADFNKPRFQFVPREAVAENPNILYERFGRDLDRRPTVVHCWTPRENVRQTCTALQERYGWPYLVHLEDNEELITRSQLGLTAAQAARLSAQDWDASVPFTLSHPIRAKHFIANAIGATVIVDALSAFVPGEVPVHLLEPGIDSVHFSPLPPDARQALRAELGMSKDASVLVYPGNMHAANAREMFSLYTAVHVLHRRGFNVQLIRLGADYGGGLDLSFAKLRGDHVTDLGVVVDRRRLAQILGVADFFVQPGSLGEFNDYRLPSKLPEFLAMGRPVVLPATNVGLRLRDGIDALLLHRGDGIEISDRVSEIIQDANLAERLAQNARRFAADNFNWNRSTDSLERFYCRVVHSRQIGNNLARQIDRSAE